MQGIPVRMRSADAADAQLLGYFAADELDALVGAANRWGVFDGDDRWSSAWGQFSIGPNGAYFEIVTCGDED